MLIVHVMLEPHSVFKFTNLKVIAVIEKEFNRIQYETFTREEWELQGCE